MYEQQRREAVSCSIVLIGVRRDEVQMQPRCGSRLERGGAVRGRVTGNTFVSLCGRVATTMPCVKGVFCRRRELFFRW